MTAIEGVNLTDLIISNIKDGKKGSKTAKYFIEYFNSKYPAELNDVYELITELININFNFFWNKVFSPSAVKLEKKIPLENFLDFERNLVEKLFLIEDINEKIESYFMGKIKFPHLEALFKGSIFVTNYRIVIPRSRQLTKFTSADVLDLIPFMGGTARRRAAKINKRRNEFNNVINQQQHYDTLYNPGDAFVFGVPFNIKITTEMISFSMMYKYKKKIKKEFKETNYKLHIRMNPIVYKKESNSDFKERKEIIFSKIKDLFSKYPTLICQKCFHIQDRNINNCTNCGTPLKK